MPGGTKVPLEASVTTGAGTVGATVQGAATTLTVTVASHPGRCW